ncbi:MAG TPA: hypothetical protein VME66_11470 [Candidatus Acidoferrales bacterium]|nr:hypothetical protein [Candidatus Acidoferrales bacterium]
MATTQRKPSQHLYEEEQRPFWLFSLIGLFVRAIIAYVAALILYIVVFHVAEMTNLQALDPSLRASFFFVLLALVVCACLIPLMQGHWTTDSRSFALMVAVSLVAVTYAQAIGITQVNPDADPETLLRQHFQNYTRPYPHDKQPHLPKISLPWTSK